jgi:hypothetical protein
VGEEGARRRDFTEALARGFATAATPKVLSAEIAAQPKISAEQKKFAERVTLSSTSPADFPLPRTVAR